MFTETIEFLRHEIIMTRHSGMITLHSIIVQIIESFPILFGTSNIFQG